jgi:6,7-dimethyl-8-ribityllumazine synthase
MLKKPNHQPIDFFNASGYRVGVVVADFNEDITGKLLASAKDAASRFRITKKNLVVYHVAGSVEIPVVLKALAETEKFDALVALGAIIRGQTDHYEYVAKIVTEGVVEVMLDDDPIPVGFGVLTCDSKKKAVARVHSGGEALAAALRSARILREIHGR